jgi:hypothetical protein
MLCIELTRNGRRLATAGVRKGSVAVFLGGEVRRGQPAGDGWELWVGGSEGSTKNYTSLRWVKRAVRANDVVVARFIESNAPDEPAKRHTVRVTPNDVRRAKAQRLRRLEREAAELRKAPSASKPARR